MVEKYSKLDFHIRFNNLYLKMFIRKSYPSKPGRRTL